MIISPESYLEEQRGKSYEELVAEKDRLVNGLAKLEEELRSGGDPMGGVDPGPDVMYWAGLMYLSELSDYMAARAHELA